MQWRGFGTVNECGEGEELVSLLPFIHRRRTCQGRYPYCQRNVGTHHVGCNGGRLLAVVPISACGVAVGRATKLVGFVH